MPQLGFGLNTCKTCQENGYDLYIKKDNFEFTPMTILIGLVIVLAIIFIKKTQLHNKNIKLKEKYGDKLKGVFMRADNLWFNLYFYLGMCPTFIYLTFFDGYVYNSWNWLIAIPVNAFLSGIFPIYWLILNPIMN